MSGEDQERFKREDGSYVVRDGTLATEGIIEGILAERAAAEDQKQFVIEKTREMLLAYIDNQIIADHGGREVASAYGALYEIGIFEDRIVLAAEDGTSFNIRVEHNDYVGQVAWQRLASAKAQSLGHDPGDWQWAGQLGYISICNFCGGMMVASNDKRPNGEQFLRPCPTVIVQENLPLDYDSADRYNEL